MKKLTKLQRHTAYLIMLEESKSYVKRTWYFGLCHLLKNEFSINVYRWEQFEKYFPELFAKKPEGVSENDQWFDFDYEGWEQRKQLLRECINETA